MESLLLQSFSLLRPDTLCILLTVSAAQSPNLRIPTGAQLAPEPHERAGRGNLKSWREMGTVLAQGLGRTSESPGRRGTEPFLPASLPPQPCFISETPLLLCQGRGWWLRAQRPFLSITPLHSVRPHTTRRSFLELAFTQRTL